MRPSRPRPRYRLLSLTATLAVPLALTAPGCGTSPPGAGFTNPNPGSLEGDKAAVRSDLPVPAASPGPDAPLAEAVASTPETGTEEAAIAAPAPAPAAAPDAASSPPKTPQ